MKNFKNYPIYDNSYPRFKTRSNRPIISNYKEELITKKENCLDYNDTLQIASYYFKKITNETPVFVNVGCGFTGKVENEILSIFPKAKIINIEPQIEQIKN